MSTKKINYVSFNRKIIYPKLFFDIIYLFDTNVLIYIHRYEVIFDILILIINISKVNIAVVSYIVISWRRYGVSCRIAGCLQKIAVKMFIPPS